MPFQPARLKKQVGDVDMVLSYGSCGWPSSFSSWYPIFKRIRHCLRQLKLDYYGHVYHPSSHSSRLGTVGVSWIY